MESFGALTGADLDNFERGGRGEGGGGGGGGGGH